jgi:hypothetical protein
MDIRSRVLAVLNGQKPDVVPWLGDLDYWVGYLNAADLMPQKYKGDGLYQLHRDLGVGFYLQGYFPFKEVFDGVEIIEEPIGRGKLTRVRTPYGEIREVQEWLPESFCIAWTERFVKTWRDLAPLRYLYEHTFYEPDYELAARRYDLIGDHGVVLCYLPKTPFMELVALRAGIETVTYALADAPEAFEETLATMERKHNEASQIALDSPAECLMIPENLSSEAVGKRMYLKYVRPHEAYWIQRIREAGKYSFIHIDGTLRGLMREVSQTGFDVLEAVTPAPAGDIPVEELWKWAEPQTVIWGGVPGVYFSDLVSDAEFDAFVIRVLEVFKTEPRYVLGIADQAPPLVRFERIARTRELVEKYGRY